MASSPVNTRPTQRGAASDKRLSVPEPAVTTELRADIRNAEELKFEESSVTKV